MNKPIETPLDKIRVIGVYAHIDAGKTTTSEAILYHTGRIHRAGSVDDGNTQLDWMEQERERGITITAAATTCYWKGCRINLIDTPGHIDFTAEVTRSIRVIDGAVIVLCGFEGVETQTETVWRYADEGHLPRLIFINKLDRDAANFERVLSEIRERLTPGAVLLQAPIGKGDGLRGVIDLLENRALVWSPGSEEPEIQPIPAEYRDEAAHRRAELVDAICEANDRLLEMRLEGREPGLAELVEALRRETIAGRLAPVLCGSAKRRIGIQPLLDAVAAFLPSPVDTPPVSGEAPSSGEALTRAADPSAPFCASVFKIVTDQHVGHLAWTRVFSGQVSVGDVVLNPRTGEQERIGRVYHLHANRREAVDSMGPGDVTALVGVKSVVTGDTLCSLQNPIVLEPFRFPEPVISVALTPPSDDERDRLHQCAARLCAEDPTLQLSFDAETGETILAGLGELHLEITLDRLRSEYGVSALASAPRIAYRETIRRRGEAQGVYRKQTGGHGHFAQVRLRVEPLKRGEGVVFENRISDFELPGQFVRAAELGAREVLAQGILAGYPLTDLKVTFTGGRYHEIDSNSMDFRIAGSMGLKQALRQAGLALLEPIMFASIYADEAYLHALMGLFASLRGVVSELQVKGSLRIILGEAPLATVSGFVTTLRHFTQGRGTFTLEFRRYEIVPETQMEEILAKRAEERVLAR